MDPISVTDKKLWSVLGTLLTGGVLTYKVFMPNMVRDLRFENLNLQNKIESLQNQVSELNLELSNKESKNISLRNTSLLLRDSSELCSETTPKHVPKHAPKQTPKQTPKQFSPKHAPKHAPKQFPKQTPKQFSSKHAARFGQGKLARNFLQSILQSMIQKNASKQKYPISWTELR